MNPLRNSITFFLLLAAAGRLHAQMVDCSGTLLSWSITNPALAASCHCVSDDQMPVCGSGGGAGGSKILSLFNYGRVSFTHWETGDSFVSPHHSDSFSRFKREAEDRCQAIAAQLDESARQGGGNFGSKLVAKFYRVFGGTSGRGECSTDFSEAAAAFKELLKASFVAKPSDHSENAPDAASEVEKCNFNVSQSRKSIAPNYGIFYRSKSGQAETSGLKIEEFPDGRAVFTDADNVRWTFRKDNKPLDGESYYRASLGSPYQLVRGKLGFRVEMPDGDLIDFSPALEPGDWRPRRYNSSDGSWMSYAYGPNGLARITDMHGRYFAFERDARGLPLTVTDQNGKKSVLTYDADGNLTSAIYPDGYKKAFSYEGGRMTSVRNGSLAPERYTYDEKGRVLTSESEGGVNRLEHYYNDAASKTVITDGLGNRSEYTQVSDHGQKLVTGITDALGGRVAMAYEIGRAHV